MIYTGILSIAQIRKYGARITVVGSLTREFSDGTTKNVPQAKRYILQNGEALEEQHYYIGNKKKSLLKNPVSLKSLYNRIKFVYDVNGVLIARRKNGVLRCTAKGMGRFVNFNKNKHDYDEKDILITHQENEKGGIESV